MKVSVAPYSLNRGRKGALIRLEEEGEGGVTVGYADLHPWPELGDAPLETQLKEKNSRLWNRALTLARIDGAARKEKINLFKERAPLKSYFLVMDLGSFDLEAAAGYEVLKIKLGRRPEEELKLLLAFAPQLKEKGLRLRLDFNNRLDQAAFNSFMRPLEELYNEIDYIEDPYPYDPEKWMASGEFWSGKLALDDRSERAIGQTKGAPVLILKPARQDEKPFKKALEAGQRVVVTSSLDHPLGQCAAAWVALQFPEEICGLASHKVYPPSPFSAAIDQPGSLFKAPLGTGFGFDQQLLEMEWTDG